MPVLIRLVNFYIRSSFHVAFSVAALVRITQIYLGFKADCALMAFAFFGTVAGYNFVKYDAVVRTSVKPFGREIKAIAAISLISILIGAAACLFLKLETLFLAFTVLGLTVLYTLPFFPNLRNARNWAGIKIYIVTLCWATVTVILPISEAGAALDLPSVILFAQRAILVFVLVLIFEIIDLKKDDPHLKTVPQNIGVKFTKALGATLISIFLMLEIFLSNLLNISCIPGIFISALTLITLLFANPERHPYYTLLWAESIPVLWWLTTTYS